MYPINNNVIIIVQARMSSTRFPGKVLKEVLDKSLLSYQLDRLKLVRNVTEVVVATTTNKADDAILQFCKEERVPIFRGSEDNVLERFYLTAKAFDADLIIRISGDCPLIDPSIVDDIIYHYINNFPNYDYVSNTLDRSFPRGMDTEVFSMQALSEVYQNAQTDAEKEHVTPYIYQHPELFKLGNFSHSWDFSNYRLTVDTEEDFELIKKILENLYPDHQDFSLDDIITLLKTHPEWVEINSHIQQKNVER